MKRFDWHSIPGALYGNEPGTFETNPKAANVIVDGMNAYNAIKWLEKRATIDYMFSIASGNEIGISFTVRTKV